MAGKSRGALSRRRYAVRLLVLAVVLLLPVFVASASAQNSNGTEFWLAFPTNYDSSPELTLFIAGDTATSGTVSISAIEFNQNFNVTPGQVTSISIPSNAELTGSETTSARGIHVTAGAPVAVYGLSRIPATTDAYLGLPVGAIGTDYIALGYTTDLGGEPSELAVVGTQDTTTVTITPSQTIGNHPAGVPFVVPLNQGQAYQLQASAGNSDISGTIISSDKPVSVFGGAKCVDIPPNYSACDFVVEQMPPTNEWGKSFVTEPLATRTGGDTFRIMASQDNTTVQINGATAATLNRAQFYETVIKGASTITADKPILVMQYSNSSSFDNVTSDPFQMMVPPFEQFLASYTVSTPASGFTNYINVVAPKADLGAVMLDGAPISSDNFSAIGNSGFYGAQVQVNPGSHTLSAPQPFGVSVYGWASFDSYGYPGGLGVAEVASVTSVNAHPKTGSAAVGTQQCVTATVTDQHGNPVKDVRVDFTVTGANSRQGFGFTDAQGNSQFCYSGTNSGNDTVTAAVGNISDTATRTWTPEGTGTGTTDTTTTETTTTTSAAAPPPPPQTDVSVTVRGPAYSRIGEDVTYIDTVRNSGPNTATGVELQSPIPAGTTFKSAKLSNGNSCATSNGKVTCFVATVPAGASTVATIVFTANQTGSVAYSATVQGDYDTNASNNSASVSTPILAQGAEPPAPPKPAAPGTFNAIALGTVLVNGVLVTPDTVFVLHSGDTVDVTNGIITITDFDGGFGTFGNVQPSPQRRTQSLHGVSAAGGPVAVFQIDQPAQVGAGVTLTLVQGDFSVCTSPRRLSAAKQTPVRQLWGKAHGSFTTKGRYSAATIRGTIWLEQDRCDGSFTNAIDDVVTVQDFVKNTTVTLNPGQTYLAQPKAPFKPPAVKKHKKATKGQTAATIRKRGLVWAGQLFTSKAQFTAWLERRGQTWQHFAATNPKFAEALAGRK